MTPEVVVGNEFIVPRPRLQAATPVGAPARIVRPVVTKPIPATLADVRFEFEEVPIEQHRFAHQLLEFIHSYSVGVFAILFLLVGSASIQLAQQYANGKVHLAIPASTNALVIPPQPAQGPNMVVATPQLEATLQRISSQAVTVTVGKKQFTANADTIKSWLKIVNDKKTGATYITVQKDAVSASLVELANPGLITPSDQVTITRDDGSTEVISAGKNGTQLGDTTEATKQITTNLLGSKGLQLNLPVESKAFASVTPAAFDKMLEVDLVSKQMWAYEKGQLVNSWPISAGAPETPTPIGQFKIYSKLRVQDMRGFNADGTRYFQPNVKWVNYFLPGGYAVHGNYWRPLSWFGARNSSHGCVSLPDNQAKWVYEWAPIGTTVIVHN